MKGRYAIPLILLSLVGAACLWAWQVYRGFLAEPLGIPEQGMTVQVERGASVRSVVARLDELGLTRADWRWRMLTRLRPVTIQAGEYALEPELKPAGLLALLASGKVVQYRFTIIEGWTFAQLLEALAADPVLEHDLLSLEGHAAIMEAIGADVGHLEGWFLPETYQFVRGDSDLDILGRAHADMQRVLDGAWEGRREDLPLSTPYELLILASIVEKESALEAERPDIAGVFVRRLERGWRLETDPTVIYGLGEAYDGDIRTRDLETDNPYNTYTRRGLPPTPIALPGRSAIEAAAHPAEGTAMFFVASGSGGHVFSDTLDEHNAAVRRMLGKTP
jgi:UPF0755 protein